ncbi:MAG: DEAD/DEAH box helicase [Candidatus Micrarchaeia archaeon]
MDLIGKVPKEIIDSLFERGIKSFTPPQESAIKNGLIEGRNIVVSAPTASGKTLIAEIASINTVLRNRKKAVYIAPMRALVLEKYEEFKKAYPFIRSIVSIGDFDSADPTLKDYDLLFVSTEKFDSLMRHKIDWLNEIGCVVFDEVHMLDDTNRGPTLEVIITKLKSMTNIQILALSATIGNADELAMWLGASLIVSEYRPIELKKGIIYKNKFYYKTNSNKEIAESLIGNSTIPEHLIVEDTLNKNKQIIVFYATKRNAESGAQKIAKIIKDKLNNAELKQLDLASKKILNVIDKPTEQCIKLSNLVKDGVAFHHAGLTNEQRKIVEDKFKENLIKVVCATTTLGYGINFPAHTVLVRDLSRYNSFYNEGLSVNEVLQLFGRAGRPKYDVEGRAAIIANTKEKKNELYKKYINARPDNIESKLGVLPVLRTHILAFIAEGFLNNKKSISEFLSKSFYSFQYKNNTHINNIIDEICEELQSFDFIEEEDNSFYITKIGKKVNELYIDPISAKWIIESLETIVNMHDSKSILYLISNTLEMRPYVREVEEAEELYPIYARIGDNIYEKYKIFNYGYSDPLRAISTALMLNDWISEKYEDEIMLKYHITPGEIHSKLMNSDWMIYSAIELAKLKNISIRELINIRVRLKYGIKEELLDLIRLEQIGRVRARMLYSAGIKKVADIKDNKATVIRLFGKDLAEKIFAQVP